jgi:hypothetical protein
MLLWSLSFLTVQSATVIPSDLARSQVRSPGPKAPSEVVMNEAVKQIEGWQARLSWI